MKKKKKKKRRRSVSAGLETLITLICKANAAAVEGKLQSSA